jgi:hypothetical protein
VPVDCSARIALAPSRLLIHSIRAIGVDRTAHWDSGEDTNEQSVHVLTGIALTYDYWHETARADGDLADLEQPQPLGPDGFLYYVRYRKADSTETPTWVDGGGFASLDEAVAAAENGVPSPVIWSNT